MVKWIARLGLICLLLPTLNQGFANCRALDAAAKEMMTQNKISGMAIAVVSTNKSEFCNYGNVSAESRDKVNEHTLFEIASISKTFTALLAAIASVEGRFDLQKPIVNYVDGLPLPIYRKINSQELLSHVSGLKFKGETNFQQGPAEFRQALNQATVQYALQTYYRYGQVGISLVALALEKIYQSNFQVLLQQLILKPLNMTETFVDVPDTYRNIATGYNLKGQKTGVFNTGRCCDFGEQSLCF